MSIYSVCRVTRIGWQTHVGCCYIWEQDLEIASILEGMMPRYRILHQMVHIHVTFSFGSPGTTPLGLKFLMSIFSVHNIK